MKTILSMLACITCWFGGVLAIQSCSAQKAGAEAAYGEQQMACVANGKTREEVDACREYVRAKWGVKLDGGGQ